MKTSGFKEYHLKENDKYYTKKIVFYENMKTKLINRFSDLVSYEFIENNSYKYLKIIFFEFIWNKNGILVKLKGKNIYYKIWN